MRVSASRQRDCEQEQRKRKHQYDVTGDAVAHTLIATQVGGVALPLPVRKVLCQGTRCSQPLRTERLGPTPRWMVVALGCSEG